MDTDAYGRRGSVAAMWCALAGVLMATALAAPLGLFKAIVGPYAPVFATGVTVLFVAAWTLGDFAGRAVFARAWSGVWTGWFLALICLTLAVFAGSLVTLFTEAWPFAYGWDEARFDYVYKPLFWVMAVGLVPCAWLAWLFAKLLTRGGLGSIPFNRARHDAFIWGRMISMIGLGIVIIIGMFWIV